MTKRTGKKNLAQIKILSELNMSKENLKGFGRTIGLCLLSLGIVLLFRHQPAFIILWLLSAIFLVLAYLSESLLNPVYKLWMGLAFCLGWINTRLILILVYYLALTPIGLMARLFKKELLSLRLDKNAQSYWLKREPLKSAKESYERIF